VTYASGNGHNDASEALRRMNTPALLVNVLVTRGLYEEMQDEAERAALAG